MIAHDHQCSRSTELEACLRQRVLERTGGHLHDLHVEVTDDHISVRGATSSAYIKDVACRTVLELLDSTRTPRLDLNIQVEKCGS